MQSYNKTCHRLSTCLFRNRFLHRQSICTTSLAYEGYSNLRHILHHSVRLAKHLKVSPTNPLWPFLVKVLDNLAHFTLESGFAHPTLLTAILLASITVHGKCHVPFLGRHFITHPVPEVWHVMRHAPLHCSLEIIKPYILLPPLEFNVLVSSSLFFFNLRRMSSRPGV